MLITILLLLVLVSATDFSWLPQLVEKKPSKFRIPESKVIPYVTKSHESDLLEKEAILELVADILSIRRSLV